MLKLLLKYNYRFDKVQTKLIVVKIKFKFKGKFNDKFVIVFMSSTYYNLKASLNKVSQHIDDLGNRVSLFIYSLLLMFSGRKSNSDKWLDYGNADRVEDNEAKVTDEVH